MTAPELVFRFHVPDQAGNMRRAADAGKRDAARAREVLASPAASVLTDDQRAALQARVNHPEASAAELAAAAGITKDAFASLIRRGFHRAERNAT